MTTLAWYAKRLRRMSAPEIGYRLNQALRRRVDRHFAVSNAAGKAIRAGLRIPALSSAELVERTRAFREPIITRARAAADHRFVIFGTTYDYGETIDWHRDPKTGSEWPRVFWGDIDYRDGTRVGGIKFAWELNRLHHWPHLALGYSVTGDPALRRELFAQVDHWQRENPYPIGINWISGIELGIRVVNLFISVRMLGDAPLSLSEQALLAGFLVQHAEHLLRYPSKYSSCANHALAEALGLFVAGQCCPDHPCAKRWREFGSRVLEREAARQIYADGSSFEHSIPYLPFVADHFLLYRCVCQLYGVPYGAVVDARLAAAVDFLAAVTDRDGHYPHIGDDDDGFLIKLDFDGHGTALSLRNTAALLYGRADWLHDVDSLDVRTKLLLDAALPYNAEGAPADVGATPRRDSASPGGPSPRGAVPTAHDSSCTAGCHGGSGAAPRIGLNPTGETRLPSIAEQWRDLKRQALRPRRQARYFPDAGLAMVRTSGEAGREILFVGNSGPLGLAPLAGHGHADALSIWLSVDGQPLLVDPGTYLYHGGGEWRGYFRSTGAHNTLRVDGADQAQIIADFMFDRPYAIAGGLEEDELGGVRWRGKHDGYRRLADPASHVREVRIGGGGDSLEIVDTVEAQGRHQVECFFHFHPQCELWLEDGKLRVHAGSASIEMVTDPQWTRCEVVRGNRSPLAGWYSSSFGRLEQAATLMMGAVTEGTARFRCGITVGGS